MEPSGEHDGNHRRLIVIDVDRLAWWGSSSRKLVSWIDAVLWLAEGPHDEVALVGRRSRLPRIGRRPNPADWFVEVPRGWSISSALADWSHPRYIAARYSSVLLGPGSYGFEPFASALQRRGVEVQLVERLARQVDEMGYEPATTAEARSMLGVPRPPQAV